MTLLTLLAAAVCFALVTALTAGLKVGSEE